MNKKEMRLITQFRKNARQPLTKISRKTGIPVSTIFDRLKQYEGSLITKHTALLNFRELGYDLRVNFLLAVDNEEKEKLLNFLITSYSTNSIFRVNNQYDFLVECIFKNMKDFQEFNDSMLQYQINAKEEYFVLEELKKEDFFTDFEMIK